MRIGAAVAALLSLVGWAQAAPRAQVRISIDVSCGPVDQQAVRRAMAIDLGTHVELETPRQPDETVITPAGLTRVAITCEDGRARIEVDDPLTGKSLMRALPWASTSPETRNRLLAVGASELVIASWAELAVTRAPESTPSTPVAQIDEAKRAVAPRLVAAQPAPVRPPSPRDVVDPRALRITVAVVSQTFFTGAGTLWGGGIGVGRDERHHLGWLLDASGAHGEVGTTIGRVSIDRLEVGLAMWFHRRWQRLALRGGPGARVGSVRFAGTATDPTAIAALTFWGPWLGVALGGAVDITITPRVALELGVEAGYVAVFSKATGFGRDVVGVDGPWVSAHFGLAVFP